MDKEQAVTHLRFSGFSDEQIKAIEGAFTCEDAVSRQAVIDTIAEFLYYPNDWDGMRAGFDLSDWEWKIKGVLSDVPPVNPQKPICPSAGVDCEDCPAYEPKILNKWIGAEVLDKIRAEIEQLRLHKAQFITSDDKVCIDSQEVLAIIDKYKAEGSGEE